MRNKNFLVYFGKPDGDVKVIETKIVEAKNAKEAIKILEVEQPGCTPLFAKVV